MKNPNGPSILLSLKHSNPSFGAVPAYRGVPNGTISENWECS